MLAVTLAPGAETRLPAANAYLLIGVAGTTRANAGGARKELKNSDYVFCPAKTSFHMSNPGPNQAELVLLELR